MKLKALVFVCTALASTAVVAQDFDAILEERQEGMKALGGAMRNLKPIMEGTAPYDAEAVHTAAETIRAHAGQILVDRFPEDSIVGDSAAKPEIWSQPEGFAANAGDLLTYATALEAAADRGLSEGEADDSTASLLGTAPEPAEIDLATASANEIYGKIGETCGACHRTYRVNKD